MYINFDELPETARVWVYQCNRTLTDDEVTTIKAKTELFLRDWAAHGVGLKASFKMPYKRFIIIGVDQEVQPASGCSIDESVQFIQQLEKDYQIDLLDKMNVSYKQGEHIAYKNLVDFKKMVKNKSVSEKTIVFNNLVNNKYEFENAWEVPMEDSWHGRFLK